MWTSRLDTPALSSPVSDTEQFCTLRSHPPWYNEVSLAGEAEARRVDSVTSVSSCGLISGHTSCSLEIGGVTPALGYVAFDEEKTNAKIDEMLGKHSAAQGERLSTTQAVFNKVRRLLPQSWPQRSRSASAEPRGVHTTAACPAAVNAPDGQENKTSRRLFQVEVQTPPRLRVGTVLPAAVPGTTTTVPSPTSTRRPRSDRVEEFHRALDNEPVRLAFGRFCKKTLSSENVEFVRKVRCKDVLLLLCRQTDKSEFLPFALLLLYCFRVCLFFLFVISLSFFCIVFLSFILVSITLSLSVSLRVISSGDMEQRCTYPAVVFVVADCIRVP